ncbi:MAG: Maf family protein, partial [Acutalibacteraceae bacterium]
MKYILASGSPRRKELFSAISESFEIDVPDTDETAPKGISPDELPSYLAAKKALEAAKRHPEDLVIGCDTVVIKDSVVLGKPRSREEARDMLVLLSGSTHTVITGCFLCIGDKTLSFSEKTD